MDKRYSFYRFLSFAHYDFQLKINPMDTFPPRSRKRPDIDLLSAASYYLLSGQNQTACIFFSSSLDRKYPSNNFSMKPGRSYSLSEQTHSSSDAGYHGRRILGGDFRSGCTRRALQRNTGKDVSYRHLARLEK